MPLFIVMGVGSPGKTTITNYAKGVTKKSKNYLFSSFYTTAKKEEVKTETVEAPPEFLDEMYVTDEEFKNILDDNGFAHTWKEKTIGSGILREVVEALEADKKVIVTLPVSAVSEVETQLATYNPTIIKISAPADLLANRRTTNKMEVKAVAKKIEKQQKEFKLKYENVIQLDNITTPQEGGTVFLDILGFDPDTDILPPDANDLQNCLPQDYLKRTVFPHLAAGLNLLEVVRPADPVDFLAAYLYKSATTTTRKVKEMTEQQRLRVELRSQVQESYNVDGRI